MIGKNSTKEEVLKAVTKDGWALKYVRDEMQIEIVQCWAKCMEQETKND